MFICTAMRTGMVKMVTCSGHEISPTWVSASLLIRRRTTGLELTSMQSTPWRLRFSMLRLPRADSESVVAVTTSGLAPSSSSRSTWAWLSLPPLLGTMQS